MTTTDQLIFTIGHSTIRADEFLALLQQHEIEAVADVRSSPYSRFNAQYNREDLEQLLKANHISYVFLGNELGARTDDPTCYVAGRVQYSRLAQTKPFHSGLGRVARGSQRYRIALMCAEKEPLECHRTLLVAHALVGRGLDVSHIHLDGTLETHESAMIRLMDLVDVPRSDLFRTHDELVAEALERQERRVAYVNESSSAMTSHEDLR